MGIDNHDVQPRVAGEGVELIEVRAVVDEKARFLAVMLHEVILHRLKRLPHALTDRDTRHNDDKLRPAVALVQLEHRLDVDIGLAGTSLHLDVETAPSQIAHQRRRSLDIVLLLDTADIREQLIVGKADPLILVANIIYVVVVKLIAVERCLNVLELLRAKVTGVPRTGIHPLTAENIHNRLNRVSLILLYFEFEIHRITLLLRLINRQYCQ